MINTDPFNPGIYTTTLTVTSTGSVAYYGVGDAQLHIGNLKLIPIQDFRIVVGKLDLIVGMFTKRMEQ